MKNQLTTLIAAAATLAIVVTAAGVAALLYWPKEQQLSKAQQTGPCALDPQTIAAVKQASTGYLKAFAPLDRPYSVKQFAFADAAGTAKTLGDWTGRIVLLNLWATWCAPCRAEMPSLDDLQGELGGNGFEVVAISVDKSAPGKPRAFLDEIAIKKMRFYHDRQALTLNALKREGLAIGLPATLLVDGRGCAVGRINGPAEWNSADAHNLIKTVLK